MTIDEAIKEQTLYLNHSDQWSHERLDKAIKLGIEALRAWEHLREGNLGVYSSLLPGETEK